MKELRPTLVVLIGFSIVLLSSLLWLEPRLQVQTPNSIYLVKIGSGFLVAWIDDENEFHYKRFFRSKPALQYLTNELHFETACALRPELKLEKLEIRRTRHQQQLLWKTMATPFTNRLTFSDSSELKFFYDSFEKGAYTPSPFGHAILFISKKSSQKRCGS